MTDQTNIFAGKCPTHEVAAYIDGELSSDCELAMDKHFSECRTCSFELSQQKQFLCGLNASLKHEKEIELPANFTKLIVANAESAVTGVRRPNELLDAVFVCVGLGLFVLFAMGAEAKVFFAGFYSFLDQLGIVAGFIGHIIFSVFLGVVIVMRTVASQFQYDFLIVAATATVLAFSVMIVSRRMVGTRSI